MEVNFFFLNVIKSKCSRGTDIKVKLNYQRKKLQRQI